MSPGPSAAPDGPEPPRWSGYRSGESGSVSVLTAGTLVLVLVLAMVSVDLLSALRARGRAQTAADAAALAAAQEIAIPSGTSPTAIAEDYAGRNGAELFSCSCEPQTSEATVEVGVVASFLFLGPDRTVTARARAVIESGGRSAQDRQATRADESPAFAVGVDGP